MPNHDEFDFEDERDRDDDRPRPRRERDPYHDRYEDYDNYDDYDDVPRRSGPWRGGRRAAAEKTTLPAIFLMIVGCLGIFGGMLNALLQASGVNDGQNPFLNQQQQNDPAVKDVQKVMKVVGPIMNLVWGSIVFFGGLQMKHLRGWSFVLFSCIWAMLPCSECCMLGIPFGIWGLVTICDSNVKRFF